MTDQYTTLAEFALGEYKEKGSKFIAYAHPINNELEIKTLLEGVRKEHPKAGHYCYAYRLGMDKRKNYRANDDGEPSGTAGKPILGQIDSHGVTNVIVIVVRYWGGTKLGVPGLIRSYKTATKDAFAQANLVEKRIKIFYELAFDYVQMNKVMKIMKREQTSTKILKQYYDQQCKLNISIHQSHSERIIALLSDIDSLTVKQLQTR